MLAFILRITGHIWDECSSHSMQGTGTRMVNLGAPCGYYQELGSLLLYCVFFLFGATFIGVPHSLLEGCAVLYT